MKILVCPLNWGLGHATRCIPLIQHWIEQQHEVVVVADGHPMALLAMRFPQLRMIELPSYTIQYSRKNTQVSAILRSLPSILGGIFREHRWLKNFLRREHFDRVVSDNRFGMWHRHTESIYITHQLNIKMPTGWTFLEPLVAQLHRYVIEQYHVCYIPDYADSKNLSGELAHTLPLPSHARFIGPLSRFSGKRWTVYPSNVERVVIVSGPEPQRTLFEQEMLNDALHSGEKTLLIRGIPANKESHYHYNNVHMISHIDDQSLVNALSHCKKIYCRSGYSTLMDLDALQCLHKAILIPTPGQTEQEYLARYHQHNTLNFKL